MPTGTPTFVLTTVEVTPDERANTVRYYLAEGELLERSCEEPMGHFDETQKPPIQHPPSAHTCPGRTGPNDPPGGCSMPHIIEVTISP
jgi:hypothetical protein